MDYGVWCKSTHVNPSRKSAHYTKQSPFEGSSRQIRARILKLIAQKERITYQDIVHAVNRAELVRVEEIIKQLLDEKFIQKDINDVYSIT
jgi:A/G-specific adenine glycosylase